jgi:hypothetical protein
MALFEVTQRVLASPQQKPTRWELWWAYAANHAKGTTMERILWTLAVPGDLWICADGEFASGMKFFASLPGWLGIDDAGTPVACRRLPPMEERATLLHASPELRAQLSAECTCDPNAPRAQRRRADRAWEKYVEQRLKQAERELHTPTTETTAP